MLAKSKERFFLKIIDERKEYHEKTENKFLSNTLTNDDESSKDDGDTEDFVGEFSRRYPKIARENKLTTICTYVQYASFQFENVVWRCLTS